MTVGLSVSLSTRRKDMGEISLDNNPTAIPADAALSFPSLEFDLYPGATYKGFCSVREK